MQVTHKKTGEIYYVEDVVIDTTNELEFEPEKQVKILYTNKEAQKFVREANEFFEKFDISEGFNLLSKACELAMINIEKFHNKCQPVEDHPCSCGSCHCHNEKEYIGEMIDLDIYKTYTQQKENCWYVPEYIAKEKAFIQLRELFNIRCEVFEIVEKNYDNATNDYFLIGYRKVDDFPKKPCQVCKLPKEIFIAIRETVDSNGEDDDLFDD